MTEFELLLQGYRPTTVEIVYHYPDHPFLLQSFIWQRLDLAPRFPVLCHFLDFWQTNLDGKLHSVRVACRDKIITQPIRVAGVVLNLEGSPTLH